QRKPQPKAQRKPEPKAHRKPPRTPEPKPRWFGLPRWVALLGVLTGLGVFAGVFGPWAQPSAQVRAIVTGLRPSSVYQAPGEPGVSMDDFDTALNISAQQSAQFRVTDSDLTPEIEEFVLSFDAETGADYGAVPTAGAIADVLATQQIVLAGLAMVFGTVAVFGAVRFGGRLLRRNTARASARRTRRAELNARLNRIADAVLNPRAHAHPDDAVRQAEVAKRYVLVLDQLEHAGSDAELTAAETEITALARRAGE